MPPVLPDDVRRMLDERSSARAARDWERADELRDSIAAL
jgi:cysteinyl-tRNA synthetase